MEKKVLIFLSLFLCFFPTYSKAEEFTVALLAVGDIMVGRDIGKIMSSKCDDYPFEQVSSILKKGDVVFGNMETVLSDQDAAPFFRKPYNFVARTNVSKSLKNAGFSVLNLANNHAMDFGAAAITETRNALNREGIAAFGAGKDLDEARKPLVVAVKGIRVAFLGYGAAHSSMVYADIHRGGTAPIRLDYINKDIQMARNIADVVIVSLHWGKEYSSFPSQSQKSIARKVIDWGADMVLGHHPHVLQGIEIYKDKIIAYSLGNFLFDQKGNGTDRSIILSCHFRGKVLSSAQIIPLDRVNSYFPMIANGKVKQEILERLRQLSLPLNTDRAALKKIGLANPIETVWR